MQTAINKVYKIFIQMFKVLSYTNFSGHRYFLSFAYDFSHFGHVNVFKKYPCPWCSLFTTDIEYQFDKTKIVRSDRGENTALNQAKNGAYAKVLIIIIAQYTMLSTNKLVLLGDVIVLYKILVGACWATRTYLNSFGEGLLKWQCTFLK